MQIRDILPRTKKKLCYGSDTFITIIVAKTRIIMNVVGTNFYGKNMTENVIFILGGPAAHLYEVLWAFHDVKNYGRNEGKNFLGISPPRRVYGGWSGPRGAKVVCAILYVREASHY